MSHCSEVLYHIIGDTFSQPIQFTDKTTGEGIEITNAMVITASIATSFGEPIADCVVTPYPNQVTDKGFVLLEVLDTTLWKVGTAEFDVKLVIGDKIKHSMKTPFKIIKGITP